jgi:RNA polymerase subunit RPABC4/transcription elongation factor Spt4
MSPELINKIGVVAEMLVAFLGASLVAFWVGFVFWTFNDIRARTRDLLTILLATLLVLVTGPLGILLYLLMRPKYTLMELYDRQLEEEALYREVSQVPVCPNCHRRVEPDWMFCPYCRTRLRKECRSCGKLLDPEWEVCPYCGEPQEQQEEAEIPLEVSVDAVHAES